MSHNVSSIYILLILMTWSDVNKIDTSEKHEMIYVKKHTINQRSTEILSLISINLTEEAIW